VFDHRKKAGEVGKQELRKFLPGHLSFDHRRGDFIAAAILLSR